MYKVSFIFSLWHIKCKLVLVKFHQKDVEVVLSMQALLGTLHQRALSMEMWDKWGKKASWHTLKFSFEMLQLVDANRVIYWQGLLIRSPEAFFHPAGCCCSTSRQLQPAFRGNFLPAFATQDVQTVKVSVCLWGKTPHVRSKTKRQSCSQPPLHSWRVKTSPPSPWGEAGQVN